jgi:diguanylate cyclase (GGDEF)-like protein/PAS domain S-box-containing protein
MGAKLQRLVAVAAIRESSPDPFLARVLGALFLCGGILVAISLLLPHPATANDQALWVIGAAAFLVGVGHLAGGQRIPRWLIHLTLAGYSLLICLSVYFTGVAAGLYPTMFIWVVLASAYFFSPVAVLAQGAWMLGGYAAVLSNVSHTGGFAPFTRWLLTAISLGVAGGFTSWLVARRRATEERAGRFFVLSRDMLCTANADGYFLELNPAWTRVLGYSKDELRAQPFVDLVHPDDRERTLAETAGLFAGGETIHFENRYRAKDGSWHWLNWSSTFSPAQALIYARATDVTEHKRVEAEREALVATLSSQARRDALTGLPNRRWFAEELQRELARAQRQDFSLCAAMIDIDHFKRYNDAHGHPAGDRLLREGAGLWSSTLRTSDFMARYGGEEFVVLLPDCTLPDARIVIDRLRKATPFGQTCSAGIAQWQAGESAEQLIARADGALYAAKAAGRDRTIVTHGEVPLPLS